MNETINLNEEEKLMVVSRMRIAAIKSVRDRTGCSLFAAKEAVEAFDYSPESDDKELRKKGRQLIIDREIQKSTAQVDYHREGAEFHTKRIEDLKSIDVDDDSSTSPFHYMRHMSRLS